MISIVMPLYNKEISCQKSLKSILSQVFGDWELIIVNDGSTDSSLSVVTSIVCNDPRVKIITQLNSGVSVARNRGIQEASNQYVAFIDADDVWNQYHMNCLYQMLKDQSDAKWFSTSHVKSNCKESDKFISNEREKLVYERVNYFKHIAAYPKLHVHSSCFMVKKSLAIQVGGYPSSVKIHEDADFYFRLARLTEVVMCSLETVVYCQGSENCVSHSPQDYPLAPFCLQYIKDRKGYSFYEKQYVLSHILECAKNAKLNGQHLKYIKLMLTCFFSPKSNVVFKLFLRAVVVGGIPNFCVRGLRRLIGVRTDVA